MPAVRRSLAVPALRLVLALALAPMAFALAMPVCAAMPSLRSTWTRLPGVVDARLANAREVSELALSNAALVPLVTPIAANGRMHRVARVGIGTITLMADMLSEGSANDPPPGLIIDVLAGRELRLGARGQVLVASGDNGVVVRWTELALPDGSLATAEVLLGIAGDVTVQYLRCPASLPRLLETSVVRANVGLAPTSGSSFRLELPRLPIAEPRANASEPRPVACDAAVGTWCDQADGPGSAMFWLDETFDDGGSAARGWTRSSNAGNVWHEVPWTTCAPGASGNSGRAWYAGSDATCSYPARRSDSLFSPAIGPLTAGARLTALCRLAIEDGRDTAEVRVNGTLVASYASPADPNAWLALTPLDLSAFAGQVVTIEFRFTSDRNFESLGWFVDDVKLYDTSSANLACRLNAGVNGMSACGQGASSEWDFNEADYCQGCTYTFYVLVECGREMHLPLDDMEGADVQITNVVTGAPVSLRCVNQTATADAGPGTYPYIDALTRDCCLANPGLERWYGPPFDETDTAGPGRVAWGMPSCDDIFSMYDSNGDAALACAELPTCGGELTRLSPGEFQVMDCSIADATGLCGLYRVDVASGGNVWSLFANCDGTRTPGFPIYFDCASAWAAYDPLPELSVANLSTSGSCPALGVSFDLVNLGCVDHPGPTTVRLTSDCVPAEVLDVVVPDAVPANGSLRVSNIPFTPTCMPVRVQAQVDPGDLVVECSESVSAAACSALAGDDTLAITACACNTGFVADAGPDSLACLGAAVQLTGSASSIAGCAQVVYRWTAPAGAVARDWDALPAFLIPQAAATSEGAWHLDVACASDLTCSASDDVMLALVDVSADAGPDITACEGVPIDITIAGSSALNCSTVVYQWLDALGDPLTPMLTTPDITIPGLVGCPRALTLQLSASCDDAGLAGCRSVDTMTITCGTPPIPLPSVLPACPGAPTLLDCGLASPTAVAWDLDIATDSDGDGIADDDADATTCAAAAAYTAGPHVARVTLLDAAGCSGSADAAFSIVMDLVPSEVAGDRATRTGASITLSWAALAGIARYRVARGTLGSLWFPRAYDHASDETIGKGACDAGNMLTWTDPDDASMPGAFYYIITAISPCGLEGLPGEGRSSTGAFTRSDRLPTLSCPR